MTRRLSGQTFGEAGPGDGAVGFEVRFGADRVELIGDGVARAHKVDLLICGADPCVFERALGLDVGSGDNDVGERP